MAVYFENQLQTSSSAVHADVKWQDNHNLLAVSSYSDEKGGFVQVYNDEGQKVEAKIPAELSTQVTSIIWHPVKPLLVIAWESGEVITWNQVNGELFHPEVPHKSPVAAMLWSSIGSRLVSADASGNIVCWKLDHINHLTMVFHHELKDAITQVVFRTVSQLESIDIGGLARAAVSGDENALDLFSSWHRKDERSLHLTSTMERRESLNFFAGSVSGVIYYVNENGSSKDAHCLDIGIQQLLYHEDRDLLVVVSEDLVLYQFQVSADGALTEITKVKLIGKALEAFVIWAGKGILVVATGEDSLRIWDVDMGDTYVIALENGNSIHDTTEIITSLAYSFEKCLLVCGTNKGNIVIWKYSHGSNTAIRNDSERSWKLQTTISIQGAIKHVRWGTSKNLLIINTVRDIHILTEQIMCAHFKDQVSAVQISPTQLSIELFATKQHINFRTDIQIRGVYVTVDHIAVWNGKKIAVYEISSDSSRLVAMGAFSASTSLVCIFDQNIYTAEDDKIHVRTYQGTIKQTLSYLENEGIPTSIEICGTYLVVGTSTGIIKVWDLSRREAKLHANPKSMSDTVDEISGIASAKCNCNGTKVSMIVLDQNQEVISKLYVWDMETDFLQYFNFETGKAEDDDNEISAGSELSFLDRVKFEAAEEINGRQPTAHFWDADDSRQLLCEASCVKKNAMRKCTDNNSTSKMERKMMVSLFVTSENKIFVQETSLLADLAVRLIGLQVPHYYLLSKEENSSDSSSTVYHKPESERNKSKQSASIIQKTLKDFIGLEDSDKKTRQAMTDFSYCLTIGNMDDAFKAIKTIKSGSVWENMAKMCVKTKRLDVASVCLGKMGFARASRALRDASKEPELDARVAMLAIQLGMLEDAEKLYLNCGRYDLLNKLYQDSGSWHKALEIGEKYDRIHLRTMYYSFAKHLELSGDIATAIPNYEKSDTHRFEVPRMLSDEPQALEEYISNSNDKILHKWWAQYMESTGEMETALQCYELAQDYLSLVRVYCYCNNLEKAAEIANETGDKAACYHLGRQYENHECTKEAVHFYTRAQAYNNAIRLCKEHGLEDQLLNLALMGNNQEIIDVARYYENKPDHQENAILLYHKAGLYGKAIDLAFQLRHFSALHQIANELTEKTDPHLLQRCAHFFMENGQFERAVDLLAVAKKYVEALDLCLSKNITITEDLAEKLSPSKDEEINNEVRNRILEKLAESCYEQGNYHLSAKKFTQAGNRIKAMKALLKSGDTEKITFFATVSRQKEIFVMAANYLQSLDWRREPEIMKNIIGFYTKGRALELLAGFYEACAQVEIDEFQNYEKAVGALNEASKCLMKSVNNSGPDQRLTHIQMKLEIIKKFIHARRLYEEDPAEAMKLSQALLNNPNLEVGIRRGDIYGFMIECYSRQQNYKLAYNLLEEMRSRMPNVNFNFYVNMKTVESIYASLDLPLNRAGFVTNTKDTHANGSGDEGEEEVEEAIAFPT